MFSSRKIDLTIGVILIALSVFAFTETLKFPPSLHVTDPGPAAWPRIISVTLFLLSCCFIYFNVIKQPSDVNKEHVEKGSLFNVIFVLLVTLVYIVLMPILGYFLMTAIYLIMLLLIFKEKKILYYVLLVSGFLSISYGVFYLLLNVRLPLGIFRHLL